MCTKNGLVDMPRHQILEFLLDNMVDVVAYLTQGKMTFKSFALFQTLVRWFPWDLLVVNTIYPGVESV